MKKRKSGFNKKYLYLLLIIPLIFILINIRGVDDWYLFGTGINKYKNLEITPVDCDVEPYDSLCELGKRDNAGRMKYIEEKVEEYGYEPVLIQIPNNIVSNVVVFIENNPDEPYIVFSAHYDLKLDTAEFEGGMDNTAGVYSLLAMLYELKDKEFDNNLAVVFSGEEETGFYGAGAFYRYTQAEAIILKEFVVVDSIGRGITYTGLIGSGTGFYLNVFGKQYRYAPFSWNEKAWLQALPYHEPDKEMLNRFKSIAKEHDIPFKYYNRMVAWGEDDQYRKTGFPTIRIYSDDFGYYFKYIHTMDDKVEYMDKNSLDNTVDLLVYYAVEA